MNRIFPFIALFVIICSCDDKIDLSVEKPHLVVGSFFSNNETIKLSLHKTSIIFTSLSEYFDSVPKARINLYEDDKFVEEILKHSDGFYKSKIVPSIGKKYSIEVKAENYPILKAEDIIPRLVKIKKMDTLLIKNPDFSHENSQPSYPYILRLFIEFTDSVNVENYYRITAHTDELSIFDLDTGFAEIPVKVNEPNVIFDHTFDDKLFNGTTKKLICDLLINKRTFELSQKMIICLRTLSQTHYKYLLYISKSPLSWEEQYYAEPITSYTNVNGGLGIFAGYAVDNYEISVMELRRKLISLK